MAESVLDFTGHELQVGDIAITGALDDLSFTWVQVTQVVVGDYPADVSIMITPLDELSQVRPRRWHVDASQLIWHSSDYAHLHAHQIAAVFAGQ